MAKPERDPVKKPANEIVVGSVVRQWTNAARLAESPLRIFSPYVTSKTVDRVFESARNGCELYTVFEAENFLTGASSIRSLLRLRQRGCRVYHVPQLHAKIVIAKPSFASVGSQNVTQRGGRSKESTAIIRTTSRVLALEQELDAWLTDAQEISLEMIREMANRVAPLSRRFKQLQQDAADVDAKVFAEERLRLEREALAKAEEARRQAAERIRVEEAAAAKRVEGLRKVLGPLIRKVNAKFCHVAHAGGYGFQNESLLVEREESLLNWGDDFALSRLYRYLCIVEETGKLGWARVAQTRITKVNGALQLSQRYERLGWHWKVSLNALWEDNVAARGENLVVRFSPPFAPTDAVEVRCWFNLSGIEIQHCTVRPGPFSERDERLEGLATEFEERPERLSEWLRHRLLAPFKYQTNLIGTEAGTFFGDIGTRWTMRLAAVDGQPLLVAHRR